MSLKLKIVLFLSVLFTIALVNTGLVYQLDEQNKHKLQEYQQQQNTLNETQHLLRYLVDAETGQRGYLLTHNTHYLQPYHNGINNSLTSLKNLKIAVVQQNDLSKTLLKVEKLLTEKFAEMAQTIDLLEAGKKADSLALVQSDQGKQAMDEIQRLLNGLTLSLQRTALYSQQAHEKKQTQIKTLVIFMMISFLFMSVITYLFLNRTLFDPFHTLITTAQKTEQGLRADIADALPKDEMGYLISRLFSMNAIVIDRTDQLSFQAQHDELTHLKNRQAFDNEFPALLKTTKQQQALCGVCFLDLNKFKPINDELGHDFGDEVLRVVAQKLKQVTRSESIYRIGGDEFVILLQNIHHRKEAESFAKRLVNVFEQEVTIKHKALTIGLSIGIAIYPEDTDTTQSLLKYADQAMYEAKKTGKTSYCFANKA